MLVDCILANSHRAYGRGWQGTSQFLLLLVGLALVVLLIGSLYYWNTLRKADDGTDEGAGQSLFTELCALHQLSRAERSLLMQLASATAIAQPAIVFVDPSSLDQAGSMSGPDAPRYQALRRKLFGSIDA